MNGFYIVGISDRQMSLTDDLTRIDLMRKKESSHAGLRITIDNRPVDRSGTPVLRKQGGMQIKSSQTGHIPDHLRQHTRRHHDLQIRPQGTQFLQKRLILQLLWL